VGVVDSPAVVAVEVAAAESAAVSKGGNNERKI
jgi:hypothetical protein